MPTETEKSLQALAGALDEVLGGLGFALFVFDKTGKHGSRTNYVSNAERADMVAALKEVVGRFEGQPIQKGRA